jgi:hypothetical protein
MLNLERITFDPQIMAGQACIRGMRIPVSLVVNIHVVLFNYKRSHPFNSPIANYLQQRFAIALPQIPNSELTSQHLRYCTPQMSILTYIGE